MSAEELRRTHIWHAIVRSAFSPSDARAREEWLKFFAQTIPDYLDSPLSEFPKRYGESICGKIGCRSLDFLCTYKIQPERADFTMLLGDSSEWQYGIESTVFVPNGQDVRVNHVSLCQDDVDEVLRAMITHPRAHLHVYNDEPRREVRIGTGLSESFLFLFQLRFQLCIADAKRCHEMDRLRGLFTLDWLKRGRAISPQRLFGL
jgi:hypothetical protein